MKTAALNLKKLLFVAASTIGLLNAPNLAWAGATLDTPRANCTTLDCGGSTISGTYVYEQQFEQAIPFNVQLFATLNECLRVTVISQNIDTEMTLISPSNQVWVNDDFYGFNPRIVANTTTKGWYTLQVTRYDGGRPGGQFTIKYGRYPVGNLNCSNPTAPVVVPQPARIKPAKKLE